MAVRRGRLSRTASPASVGHLDPSSGLLLLHVDFNVTRPALADRPAGRRCAWPRTGRVIAKINYHSACCKRVRSRRSAHWPARSAGEVRSGRSERVLDAAGWKRGADGVRAKNGLRLAFNWASTTGTPDGDRMLEAVRATWQQIGVTFEVHRYQPALFFAPFSDGGTLFAGKFDVTSFSCGQTPDGDYTPTNGCAQIPPGGENVTRSATSRSMHCWSFASRLRRRRSQAGVARARAARRNLCPYFVLYIRGHPRVQPRSENWKPNSSSPFDDFMNDRHLSPARLPASANPRIRRADRAQRARRARRGASRPALALRPRRRWRSRARA